MVFRSKSEFRINRHHDPANRRGSGWYLWSRSFGEVPKKRNRHSIGLCSDGTREETRVLRRCAERDGQRRRRLQTTRVSRGLQVKFLEIWQDAAARLI